MTLPRGWSHAQDELGIRHDVCGVVVHVSPDAMLDQLMRAVGTHEGKCTERHPPKRAFQDQPDEPGYYWARCNQHGWMVESIDKSGQASNDSPIAEWGPRIPEPPPAGIPTEPCSECNGRGWEYARSI